MSDRVDTEALATELAETFGEWLFRMHGVTSSCRHADEGEALAGTVLESSWLAARDARVHAEMVERIKEFDFSDDYHQGDDPEGRYYAGIDRACRLILGDIATWTDPRPVGEGSR